MEANRPIHKEFFMNTRLVLRATVLFGLAAFSMAHACGPFFPNAYLTFGAEEEVLRMPEAAFYHELAVALGQSGPIGGVRPDTQKTSWDQTLAADVADLEDALKARGDDADSIRKRVEAYTLLRNAMNDVTPLPHLVPVPSDWRNPPSSEDPANDTPATPFNLSVESDLLTSIPEEFALYVRGAAAYRAKDTENAAASWKALLDLPEAKRLYRSVWAAYMLGKTFHNSNPAESVRYFALAREFATDGFRDRLALVSDSLGWQAHVAMTSNEYAAAMKLYVEQYHHGTHSDRASAYVSLRWLCTRAMNEPESLQKLAADPVCERVVTAWVVAHPNAYPYPETNQRWLDAVSAQHPDSKIDGADRLAWSAYNNGDIAMAQRWLDAADPTSLYAQWVKSKLLLRDGKIDEALDILRTVSKAFPLEESWVLGHEADTTPRDIVHAELGVLLLGRQDYANALDCLMRAGYWIDAAYVAERVLTVEELEMYVNEHTGDPALAQPLNEFGYWNDRNLTRLTSLRNLLARRLGRLNRWDAALSLYSDTGWPAAEELMGYLAETQAPMPEKGIGASVSDFFAGLWGSQPGHTIDRPRANAFYEAAKLMRRDGMELTGTEVEPDWALYGGSYELTGATGNRGKQTPPSVKDLNPALVTVLTASDDEVQRASAHAPDPDKRFHYRYVASEFMWQAAQYLPDNDMKCASALYWGGVYLKYRDPQAADKFYKALVWRNRNLPYAQAADAKRWFPPEPPE